LGVNGLRKLTVTNTHFRKCAITSAQFSKLIFASIWPALSTKHRYSSAEEYMDGAQKKFSLLETGIMDTPSTRLLLINVSYPQLTLESDC
jgi:hypothetical protein